MKAKGASFKAVSDVSWRSRGGTKSIVALSYTGFHRLGAEGENTLQAATKLRKETALVVYIGEFGCNETEREKSGG